MTDISREELETEEARAYEIDTMLYLLRTATVGQVIEFQSGANTVTVQPVIMGKKRDQGAKPLPPLVEVPVSFYGAGDWVVTHKPKAGDVCLLVASDRSLSRWKQSGGVADPAERRRHNLSDSVALFGLNHFGAAYQGIKDGVDVRSRDGQTSLHLSTGGLQLTHNGTPVFTAASGGVTFNVPVTGPSGTFGGIVVESHLHTGVTPGSGNTGGPV